MLHGYGGILWANWVAAAWSLLMPGLGHLYTHRIPTSFYLLTWWVGTSYLAHFLAALHLTLAGNFAQAVAVINPQWFLFMAPIYPYADQGMSSHV